MAQNPRMRFRTTGGSESGSIAPENTIEEVATAALNQVKALVLTVEDTARLWRQLNTWVDFRPVLDGCDRSFDTNEFEPLLALQLLLAQGIEVASVALDVIRSDLNGTGIYRKSTL
jgi:hypothetical protein